MQALKDPGCGYEDSQVEVGKRRVYSPVRWKTKPDLSELRGQRIALQIEIKGATLYSFSISVMAGFVAA